MAVKITAAMVKQLREMTDSPMMECKKALVEADGDIEKAVDVLRTMGIAKAVKRAGRDTNEGAIAVYISEDGKQGGIVELTCETDFVASNPKFTGFANDLAKVVAENGPADEESLKALPLNGSTVADELTEMIHVTGENMKVARFQQVNVESGALAPYVHHDGKKADIVVFSFANDATASNEEFQAMAHDVAMQVVATAPVSARRDEVPADVVEHEKEIYRAQAAESGRPEKFWDGIINGRLKKFYQESVLAEQDFFKDPNKTVSELVAEVSKAVGDEISIVTFVSYTFGE